MARAACPQNDGTGKGCSLPATKFRPAEPGNAMAAGGGWQTIPREYTRAAAWGNQKINRKSNLKIIYLYSWIGDFRGINYFIA